LNNAQGPNNTVTQYDAAALFAILEACRILERGAADAMLAGGTDTRAEPISVARGLLHEKLSRNQDYEKASRPYARDRGGEVVAEGAGILVLERPDHARRRGAQRLAEIVGHASTFDRGKTGDGLVRAIRTAMTVAGIGPADLDHVNAAASGSVSDDVWEARALYEALEGIPVPVLAMKSYLGNAGNGASGLELAASVLALSEGTLPASLNADDTDPACPVLLNREPRPVRRPYALKVSWTDQGQCAALVIRKVAEG
jgi:3-oxoacyl-[acyl-carrier-protein] synthase II